MLILRLSKREDQALIPISNILKFPALSHSKVPISDHIKDHGNPNLIKETRVEQV